MDWPKPVAEMTMSYSAKVRESRSEGPVISRGMSETLDEERCWYLAGVRTPTDTRILGRADR